MNTLLPWRTYADYDAAWQCVANEGWRDLNLDVWAGGRRYLSLATVCLSPTEAAGLRRLALDLAPLLDLAVDRILADPEWWPALAWPWPAIELARQEPPHPGGACTLYGRFDCLLDENGRWQAIEYNADTPSGGREASGLEPAIARLLRPHGMRAPRAGFSTRLVSALRQRIAAHPRPVHMVGVVSSHSWIEDMSQATWLAWLLRRAGQPALVGDVTDLVVRGRRVTLRGQPIDALYRFYPIERLYRHAVFADLFDAVAEGRLLPLNGLRGFLAQSKACLAWLWANRDALGASTRAVIERHVPPTLLARDPAALDLLPDAVVKHVNGREGDSVVFGRSLDAAAWEARLLETGYVVQRAIAPVPVQDVAIDEWRRELSVIEPRYACVGAFVIGGRFGGCYTRLDGPVTSARATYAATLVGPPALAAAAGVRGRRAE